MRLAAKRLALFQQLDAPVLIAQTHFQLAYTSLLSQDGFDVYEIYGLKGDILLDSGWVEFYRGNYTATLQLRANILFSESRNREAIPLLQNALTIARQEGADAEAAASMQLLGEALTTLNEFEQAFAYLEAAENSFFEMGMNKELAYCQVAWGNYYTQVGNLQSAQAAWKQALALNQDVMPDITWPSHARLAAVSEARGDHKSALAHYRAMIRALARLRRGLWQPALASSFLHRPLSSLDAAISLAARQAAHLDALHFIEESKAQTVARQLTADSPWPGARVEQPLTTT